MIRLRELLATPTGNALLVSLAAFLVYLKTLAPSVTFIDSGELAAVACTLGIAHPTGYPLFTLLGWFFSRLPIAAEEIVRLNIMAAFFCAAGVFFFFKLVHFVLTGVVSGRPSAKNKKKDDTGAAVRIASIGASLLLAFSETYWSQGVAIEVYSLHVLLVLVTLFAFVKAVYSETWDENAGARVLTKWWLIFAFSLGLSFTNHMTTILLAPGLLYLYFATQGFGASSWKRIGMMTFPFLAGFSVYLYLPFRAAQSPLLNWGNPVSLEKFLWHWTGKQYRVWIFSSSEAAGKQLKYFVESLPGEFAVVGLAVALLGVIFLLREHRRISVSILLLFLGCMLYSINYDIHDIDSYFLLAYIALAIFAGAGLFIAYRWLSARLNRRAATVLLIAVSLVPLVVHYDQTDETGNYLVEDYTMNMFSSLQPNALVLSYQWDFWLSASLYYQHVRKYRSDVAVVDKELLRRSWYFRQLERQCPWLIGNSRSEIDAFEKELYKFEHEVPYDGVMIEARYVEMIRSLIVKSLPTRPVYVTTEIEPEFTAGFQRVPEGLALRIYADTLRHEMRDVEFQHRKFERSGRLEVQLKYLYASAFVARGIFLLQSGDVNNGKDALREALVYDPNSREALSILSQVR